MNGWTGREVVWTLHVYDIKQVRINSHHTDFSTMPDIDGLE